MRLFYEQAVNGSPTPTVYGDGLQTRDYIYVGDVVSAFIAAVDSEATGIFNVGTGVETNVLELAPCFRPRTKESMKEGDSDFSPARAVMKRYGCSWSFIPF